MTPRTLAILAAAGILTYTAARILPHLAARYLERLLADALDHDWASDLDTENPPAAPVDITEHAIRRDATLMGAIQGLA